MFADYHTHTPLCLHAEGTPEEYVAAALVAGLAEYGIADHAPVTPEPFDDWRMSMADLPAYFAWIERAKLAARGTNLQIRAGLECDWLPNCRKHLTNLREKYDWDYFIGSVHYLSDWDFDNPKWLEKWARLDVADAWQRYWQTYAEMAQSGLFEIVAHSDLIKKFGYFPEGDLEDFYWDAIDAIAAAGCAIEINTAGWHKPCAEAYPAPRFLELAAAAGIPLVLSSDAHHPREIARDFSRAAEMAKLAGYRETVRLCQGKFTFHPLP